MSDSMSPGDIAELSQSSSLAFRIIGNMNKLPSRNELYWRAMVLDQYDGKTWTSSFVNQQPVLNHRISSKAEQGFDYQYLAADSSVMWIMGLEKSIPKTPQYQLKQDFPCSIKNLLPDIFHKFLHHFLYTQLPLSQQHLHFFYHLLMQT